MPIIEKRVKWHLEEAGVSSLLVAVSGGADSVALLRACASIASRSRLRLEAVNCNFHLRDEESDRDSSFVEDLCSRLGVTLHSLDYNVAHYMEEHQGVSTEMACRELRYADFFRICREEGIERVAVAHNADDDIETMMLSLLRGSGSRGLRGMDIDNGRVIRPLLETTRGEIETYLTAIRQEYITDSSNLTSDYRRNFIRRDVLPMLESRWPGVRKSLFRTLAIMKEESEIVDRHYRSQIQNLSPDARTLLVYADGVTTGTVTRFIEPFGGNTSIACEILESLRQKFGERRWLLSDRYIAVLERDRLTVFDREERFAEPTVVWEKMEMTNELMGQIQTNRCHDIIYLPHDTTAYELRSPRVGDRISPLGMNGTRLVSDIISDARLDRRGKECVRVLTRRSDGEVIWVTGLKRSCHELIKPSAAIVYKAAVSITEIPIPAESKPTNS